ncbi:MAG TPA: quinone-dependent dihydroorotate dehydrogenase [Candidatus Binataceae bacterium]|nr:quinone-dependent dihydroorotate dehydrogenase [Candidatus Binataceae bacterium]
MTADGAALYRRVVRPLLFRLDPETTHRVMIALLHLMPDVGHGLDPPALAVRLGSLSFKNPLGLAAGMDKDARAPHAWQALGFGFAEMGTVTPRPQAGNPRPRVWRLPEFEAIVNQLGFPSAGMKVVGRRLKRLRRAGTAMRLGLNFGPNRDTPPERIAGDYRGLVEGLGAMADFIVINVSSPNTPGLRDWQAPNRLRPLLESIVESASRLKRSPPVMVKLASDLDAQTLAAICETVAEAGLAGIVACNTTIERESVGVRCTFIGGLSGRPLKSLARSKIGEIYRCTKGSMPIIGVGGISSAEDAYGHIRAGAALVEVYTGLMYEGPMMIRAIKRGLLDLLRRDGFRSISEAVGAESR